MLVQWGGAESQAHPGRSEWADALIRQISPEPGSCAAAVSLWRQIDSVRSRAALAAGSMAVVPCAAKNDGGLPIIQGAGLFGGHADTAGVPFRGRLASGSASSDSGTRKGGKGFS